MSDLLTLKILSALAILAVGVIGGVIPIVAQRFEGSRRFFSLGNAFAGGLFLGAGFIHLLPDASAKLADISGYPLAGVLAALGLTLLLLIDRVLFDHRAGHQNETRRSGPSPYVLAIMLSVHSIIAGVALGLETHISTSIVILLAILFHKGSEAFALLVSLHSASVDIGRQKQILSLFVLMTPLGLLLGATASATLRGDTATLLEGAFDALAAGTFIYVAMLDIISEELSKSEDRPAKFLLIVFGIACMATLALWT